MFHLFCATDIEMKLFPARIEFNEAQGFRWYDDWSVTLSTMKSLRRVTSNDKTLTPRVLYYLQSQKIRWWKYYFFLPIRRLDSTIESQDFSNNWVFMMLLHYLNAGQEKLDLFQFKKYVMIFSLEIRCVPIHSKQSLWIARTSWPLR